MGHSSSQLSFAVTLLVFTAPGVVCVQLFQGQGRAVGVMGGSFQCAWDQTQPRVRDKRAESNKCTTKTRNTVFLNIVNDTFCNIKVTIFSSTCGIFHLFSPFLTLLLSAPRSSQGLMSSNSILSHFFPRCLQYSVNKSSPC